MASKFVRVVATGTAQAGPCWLKSVVLTGGSAAGTLDIRDGASGAIVASFGAAIGGSSGWTTGDQQGVYFSTGVHATVGGTGASASFEVEV